MEVYSRGVGEGTPGSRQRGGRAARPSGAGDGRKLTSLTQVALRLREILDEGDRSQAPPTALAAQGLDVPHPAQELGPGHACGRGAGLVTGLAWSWGRHDLPSVRGAG